MRVRRVVLLVSVLGVCLLLLTLQTRGEGASAGQVVAFVTTPLQTVLTKINRSALGLWATYLDWKNVRAENRHRSQRPGGVAALRLAHGWAHGRPLRRSP